MTEQKCPCTSLVQRSTVLTFYWCTLKVRQKIIKLLAQTQSVISRLLMSHEDGSSSSILGSGRRSVATAADGRLA